MRMTSQPTKVVFTTIGAILMLQAAAASASMGLSVAPVGTRGNAASGNDHVFVLDKGVAHVDASGIGAPLQAKDSKSQGRLIAFYPEWTNDPGNGVVIW